MFHVVLFQPEIPPNTGNIMRLCANTGSRLHLIEPLGFSLQDKELRRAGLDYHEWVDVRTYTDLESFTQTVHPPRMLAFSTRGRRLYTEIVYKDEDAFVFGPETRGLPQKLFDTFPEEHCLRLPLEPNNRSLNLSNTVAIVVYEAWRQLGFIQGR
ncbi:MAG: tRNA (uridine(34)/cytosine(34)/5-carboxymethylaminomethyluridine(34)-2'-O)-methyltransferase TrmL [Sulfuricaulis sp.]|uniref:tRNA (uridine(34)/cytosine(34)/5- carboxymethylaminomethyluridine(34)-2'-O)- methyltransferase TrmL n=1 Tax=Sulfuricaulis sp. TaxID=2003553 RepID=UPI0034A35696